MFDVVKVKIRGISPLLMHNPRLLDPSDMNARGIAAITSKQKKKRTDDDLSEVSRLEFVGGLYTNAEGVPVIPGENLEGMIRDGATNKRQGKMTLSAVMCDGAWPLQYTGPKNVAAMWEDKRFVDTRRVAMSSGAGIMRTRPIFTEWACEFDVHFDPQLLNRDDLKAAIEFAGQCKGIMDFRPKFGRFEIVSFN